MINNQLVGLIEISNAPYENCLCIDNFEIINKNNGVGSKVIKEIIKNTNQKNLDLCLYSNDEKSKRFWNRNEFVDVDDGTGVIMQYYSCK